LCIVVDGMGEMESLSVYDAQDGVLTRIGQIGIGDSIGILYSLATRHLGFKFNADEYKLMGLAPYGDPATYRDFFASLVQLQDEGRFEVRYQNLTGNPKPEEGYRDILARLASDVVGQPGDVEGMDQRHHDFAAAAQESLERALMHAVAHWQRKTGRRHLCLAGGVALNCTFNGKLIERRLFDRIYIQPAAGDDGSALGAALVAAAQAGEKLVDVGIQEMPFYGPEFTPDQILEAARVFEGRVLWEDLGSFEAAAHDAACGVRDDLVQAWFQGRMEFGPRALGNRTILANPAAPDIKATRGIQTVRPGRTARESRRLFRD
jgi:carbamoyltransferase